METIYDWERVQGFAADPVSRTDVTSAAHLPDTSRRFRIAGFNLFEFGLVALVSVISLYFFALAIAPVLRTAELETAGFALVDVIAAFCGICSVVLCAKGKRSGFLFGLINAVGYALISFHTHYYGEVMLNVFFYIPANIVSYALWTRHKDEQRGGAEVKARALSVPQLVVAILGVGAVTFAYHFLLKSLGGEMALLDGATTILSIFATVLMALRYSEQWFFWIIVDVTTVVLWCFAADPVMIALWSAYLVNAAYGYLMWLNKSGRNVPFKPLLDRASDFR